MQSSNKKILNMDKKSDGAKRKRGDNWLEEDKNLLKELVKERVSVIENKNTDTNTNSKKKKAWKDLEETFNQLCKGTKRTIVQLKSQWGVTKLLAKKEESSYRKESFKTGGGPPPSQSALSSDDIKTWLPQEFVVDFNVYDSDQTVEILEEEFDPFKEQDDDVKRDENSFQEIHEEEIALADEVKENTIQVPKKTKRQISNKRVSEDKIKKIADVEVQCRMEIHKVQMENEHKKGRNLDLEFEIFQLQLKNYKQQE